LLSLSIRTMAIAGLAAAACTSPTGEPGGDDDPGGIDAGGLGGDDAGPGGAVCSYAAPDPDFVYPAGPYGVQVGDVLAPFSYQDCDGKPVTLAEVLSQGDVVLFNVATGWCPRCTAETSKIETALHQAYCARGLRIVQVLTEDAQSNPASASFCAEWRARYGLTYPVLIDPGHTTAPYFAGGAQPLNLLVDRLGVIRYRSVGVQAQGLPAAIEGLLGP
jgi:peroxiredoxin